MHETPRLISGGLRTDERGTIAFVNDFDFAGVRRSYTIRPARAGQVRGWIGHRREHKWFMCVQGQILIAVVRPDRWEHPSRDLPLDRFTLSAAAPAVLWVPPGHATASLPLSEDTLLTVFSSSRLDAAAADDYRYPPNTWDAAGSYTP